MIFFVLKILLILFLLSLIYFGIKIVLKKPTETPQDKEKEERWDEF